MGGPQAALRAYVLEASGQNPFRCYQCGNCSAGCPMAGRGDMLPHQVMRLLQLDDEDALGAVQPWLCVGCQICAVRCPQELDLSRVMDALRAEALRRGTVPAEARRMAAFNKIFLDQVLAIGRLREVFLGARFNLAARAPMENMGSLPGLVSRGKMKIGGHVVRGPGLVRRQAEKEAAKTEGRQP